MRAELGRRAPARGPGDGKEVTRRGTSRVQTAYGLTDAIEIERGVRQGAVLSPFVFNAFMEPLAQLLKQGAPYVTAGGTKVQGYFFADDIWNVSDTYAGIKEKVIIETVNATRNATPKRFRMYFTMSR